MSQFSISLDELERLVARPLLSRIPAEAISLATDAEDNLHLVVHAFKPFWPLSLNVGVMAWISVPTPHTLGIRYRVDGIPGRLVGWLNRLVPDGLKNRLLKSSLVHIHGDNLTVHLQQLPQPLKRIRLRSVKVQRADLTLNADFFLK